MAIGRANDVRDSADRLIDDALASYANAAPQWGFERRIVRAVTGGTTAARTLAPRWIWVFPTVAAGFILGVLAGAPLRSAFGAALNPSIIGQWCLQLQGTWVSTSIRESLLLFPYLDGIHLLGLAVMLGPSMMLDLRLLGFLWKRDPVSKIAAKFLPLTLTGFGVVVTAGMLLFISEPMRCFQSPYFRLKMGLIVLAGINALAFHATIDRRRSQWDMRMPPPPQARLAGMLGLILWTSVILAGRYMAYNFTR